MIYIVYPYFKGKDRESNPAGLKQRIAAVG